MGACCSNSSAAAPYVATAPAATAGNLTLLAPGQPGGKGPQEELSQAAMQCAADGNGGGLAARCMLLISDNLPHSEILVEACLSDVVVVSVQYQAWGLDELRQAMVERAGPPGKQFASVGLLDHGTSGKFCLLRSLSHDGYVDLPLLRGSPDLQEFFKFLAAYVRSPQNAEDFRSDVTSRIDLMACSVAASDDGLKLVDALEELTQVNWAASTDRTGCGEGVENGFDWVLETEDRLGLGSVHKDYFKEHLLRTWQHHCEGAEYPYDAVAERALFLTSKYSEAIYDVDTMLADLDSRCGAKIGAGSTRRLLGKSFPESTPLGREAIVTNDDLRLHDRTTEHWVDHFVHYAGKTRHGVLVLAGTVDVFKKWCSSKACQKEVEAIPEGRLFAYVDGTIVTISAHKAAAPVKDGQGIQLFLGGKVYKGRFKANKRHGQGKYDYASGAVYNGQWEADEKHGQGMFTYVDGSVYQGKWKAGKRHGQGNQTYASGNMYVGQWEADEKHGQGNQTYADGGGYQGKWEAGKMHGQGKYTYADGNMYVGEWEADKQHGQGKHTWADGDVYEGQYKADVIHGQGKFTWASGTVYVGQFEADKFHGKGKKTDKGGKILKEGQWRHDEFIG